MKKSGHIKPHIHVKNKTKGVKDTKFNIFVKILNYNDILGLMLLKYSY